MTPRVISSRLGRRSPLRLLPVVALALLAGCAGPVPLTPADPSGAAARMCRELVSATPDSVDGQDRRETDPPSDYTEAWGDPAITLSCGVDQPPGLGPTSKCFEVNGVGWYAERRDQRDEVRFTTIGRRTFVEVTVPGAYAPEANPLVDLAAAISEHIPEVDPCV